MDSTTIVAIAGVLGTLAASVVSPFLANLFAERMFDKRIRAERENAASQRVYDLVAARRAAKFEAYEALMKADDKYSVEVFNAESAEQNAKIQVAYIEPLRRAQLLAPARFDEPLSKLLSTQMAIADLVRHRADQKRMTAAQVQHGLAREEVLNLMREDLDSESALLLLCGEKGSSTNLPPMSDSTPDLTVRE